MESPAQEIYLGLMTGTSLDGVDAVVVSFADNNCQLLGTHEHAFPDDLKVRLLALIDNPSHVALDEIGSLNRELGMLYADAVQELLQSTQLEPRQITAIGCHGQTIRHRPDAAVPFSMQIGDAATLANQSNIATVADFRSADIALGGQGAPLVPAFHQWLVGARQSASAVVNIGGIANISVLRPTQPPLGFDTGPGNTLLDTWCTSHTGKAYDKDGAWAATGTADEALLDKLLTDSYFRQTPPKSTGREYFNLAWLQEYLTGQANVDPADIQATLAELTATSIADSILEHVLAGDVWLCGGGALNKDLCQRIQARLPDSQVRGTDSIGLPPAWVEAAAFAWLAKARLAGEPAGTPSVTGACRAGLLGAVHRPTKQ